MFLARRRRSASRDRYIFMPATTGTLENIRNRPTDAVMEDMLVNSQRALEDGARATAEINELKRRVDDVLDWRKQLDRHPWLTLSVVTSVVALTALIILRKAIRLDKA